VDEQASWSLRTHHLTHRANNRQDVLFAEHEGIRRVFPSHFSPASFLAVENAVDGNVVLDLVDW